MVKSVSNYLLGKIKWYGGFNKEKNKEKLASAVSQSLVKYFRK